MRVFGRLLYLKSFRAVHQKSKLFADTIIIIWKIIKFNVFSVVITVEMISNFKNIENAEQKDCFFVTNEMTVLQRQRKSTFTYYV